MCQGAPSKAGRVAFLFPGQGSQYPFMLPILAERFPVVAQTFQEADEILASLGLPTVTSSVFLVDGNQRRGARRQADAMKDTQLLQPMILTANAAIFRLLSSMGVRPVACAGHSLVNMRLAWQRYLYIQRCCRSSGGSGESSRSAASLIRLDDEPTSRCGWWKKCWPKLTGIWLLQTRTRPSRP
jgi:hypothetical protein